MPTLSEVADLRVRSTRGGLEAANERAVDVDRALVRLAQDVLDESDGVSVIAVGGYGRCELSPRSDIDLLFAARRQKDIDRVAGRLRHLLYPLWDAGLTVGHATLTARTAVDRTRSDAHALTALLHARHITGDRRAFEELVDRRARSLQQHRKGLIRIVQRATTERHREVGEAGWTLAPDIKNDKGGLRDLTSVRWLEELVGEESDSPPEVTAAHDLLLTVREVLHTRTGRRYDRLRLDLQIQVAETLDVPHPHELMARVHLAARAIEAFQADRTAALSGQVLGGPRRTGNHRSLEGGLELVDGELRVAAGTPKDVTTALRLVAHSAVSGSALSRRALLWLKGTLAEGEPSGWDPAQLDAFATILTSDHPEEGLRVLDQADAWGRLLPEWMSIRGLSSDDLYHSFTVDAHLFRTVREVKRVIADQGAPRNAAEELGDLRNVYLAALLHDVGKGSGGDHSVEGEHLARSAVTRMGLAPEDIEEVSMLVRHHLLLPDTATRRDLDDGAVIGNVAEKVRTERVLRGLFILAVADALATGTDAWTSWKEALVTELYVKVLRAIQSGAVPEARQVRDRLEELRAYDPVVAATVEPILSSLPHSYLATEPDVMADELRMLARKPGPGELLSEVQRVPTGWSVTICMRDRPGALARTAGVLALHRANILNARVFTTSEGLALQRFLVQPPEGTGLEWLKDELGAAISGRLALDAKLAQKVAAYHPGDAPKVDVRILQNESDHSTVIEVRAPDRLGSLYATAAALAEVEADVHVAKIDTLGDRAVDVFYVRSARGEKLDIAQISAAQAAIEHRFQTTFG